MQAPCFTAKEEDGGDTRLVELELACEAYGTAPPDLLAPLKVYQSRY